MEAARVDRRAVLRRLTATLVSGALGSSRAAERPSPGIFMAPSGYGLAFADPLDHLIGDLLGSERGDPARESSLPHHEWYSEQVRHKYGAWGPPARRYLPLPEAAHHSPQWKRERVLAAAARFLGYGYQHHHIPDWDPPAHWHWKPTCVGHNGKGFDCSNFTSFVYNQAFGLKMSSAIGRQSASSHALLGGEREVPIRRIELRREAAHRYADLETGDLLYIRGREGGRITHVVFWVGTVGRATSGLPLLLDSHGGGVKDDQGRAIACGVQLRPLRPGSWYDRCASHAHRLFG